jgi:hypothetical protein
VFGVRVGDGEILRGEEAVEGGEGVGQDVASGEEGEGYVVKRMSSLSKSVGLWWRVVKPS